MMDSLAHALTQLNAHKMFPTAISMWDYRKLCHGTLSTCHVHITQVRFHPLDSDIFASGSLDHKVVVWRISTGEKVYSNDFGARKSEAITNYTYP